MICEPSRTAALGQLDEFIPIAGLYARDRNHVKSKHPSVSRLAPAIRHRLISEDEVATAVLRAQSVENTQSGNVVIDYFANELVSTGYLHNHARMWFAAWWVHEARLPWQRGAAFFYRHLLDGDPAPNTLLWRWVAGLQTPGKTYLARRSNLEKYLAPELLESLSGGLGDFDHPDALLPEHVSKPPITQHDWPLEVLTSSPATGLWIHEEDLSVENSPLGRRSFSAIMVTGDAPGGNAGSKKNQMSGSNRIPMNGVKKQNLPEKICQNCQRPFAWRKKWARDWENVRYCSDACRRGIKMGHA